MRKLLILFLFLINTHVHSEIISKKYIITGGPGTGKTSVILYLESILHQSIVREAAADLIILETARGIDLPSMKPDFNDKVIALQKLRQEKAKLEISDRIFFDRSHVDVMTYDIRFTGKVSPCVKKAIDEVIEENFYEPIVFLIENFGESKQGFLRPETLEEALLLEKINEENYRKLGFEVIKIGPGSVKERAEKILEITLSLQQD